MFEKHQIDRIIGLINTTSYETRTLLVGIDGLAGAGKSTLANQLVDCLPGSRCVNIDNFYRPIHLDQITKLESDELFENFFDWRRLRDHLLIPAGKGLPAVYQKYDWECNKPSHQIEIPSSNVLVVEGVFGMLPALRAFYHVKIYVDTPKHQRMSRITRRRYSDLSWMNAWMVAEDWYVNKFSPQSHVDAVIRGSL